MCIVYWTIQIDSRPFHTQRACVCVSGFISSSSSFHPVRNSVGVFFSRCAGLFDLYFEFFLRHKFIFAFYSALLRYVLVGWMVGFNVFDLFCCCCCTYFSFVRANQVSCEISYGQLHKMLNLRILSQYATATVAAATNHVSITPFYCVAVLLQCLYQYHIMMLLFNYKHNSPVQCQIV